MLQTIIQSGDPVSDDLKSDWNNFVKFAKTKNMSGSSLLDNRDKNLGKDLIDQYIKTNPNSKLRYDSIPLIQQSLQNYRKQTWDQIQAGKMSSDAKDYDHYMSNLSQVDGWLGSKTSQAQFPIMIKNNQDRGVASVNKVDNLIAGKFDKGGKIGGVYNPDIYGVTNPTYTENDPLNYQALTNEGYYNNSYDTIPQNTPFKSVGVNSNPNNVNNDPQSNSSIAGAIGSGVSTLQSASQTGGKLANTGLGKFINSNEGNLVGAGVGAATNIVSAFSGGTHSGAEKGKAIGSAIGTVADVATFGLPIFSTIGGAIGGLIGGGSDNRENAKRNQVNQLALASKKNILVQSNDQKYGSNFYGEDGGQVMDMNVNYMDEPQQAPPPVKANIEKGEISVDPEGKVLRDFKNPNRFSSHNKNPYKEPSGNFIDLNQGEIIIPKKFAKTYKDGDDITKKSILRTILEQQKDNPAQNLPASQQEDLHMADGGLAYKPKPVRYPLSSRQVDNSIIDLPSTDYTIQTNPVDINRITEEAPQVTLQAPTNTDYKSPYATQAPTKKQPDNTDYGYYVNRAMPYLPQIANLAIANEPDRLLSLEHNANSDIARNYLENLDTNYDTSLNLHLNQQALGTAQRSLHDFNSPASKVQASEMLGRTLEANNQVINTKNNAETQLKNQKNSALSQFLNNTGLQEEQERLRYQQEQRMNEGNRLSATSQILSNVSDIAQQQYNDNQRIKSLNSMTDFHDLNPATKSLIVDDPGSRDKILKLVNAGYNMQTAVKMVLGIQAAEDGKDSSSTQRQATKTQVKTGNRTTTTTSSSSNKN